jgi:hypothetical protein
MVDFDYKKLWVRVLTRTIRDVRTIEHRKDALQWLLLESSDVGGVVWICEGLGLDFGVVKSWAKKEAQRYWGVDYIVMEQQELF